MYEVLICADQIGLNPSCVLLIWHDHHFVLLIYANKILDGTDFTQEVTSSPVFFLQGSGLSSMPVPRWLCTPPWSTQRRRTAWLPTATRLSQSPGMCRTHPLLPTEALIGGTVELFCVIAMKAIIAGTWIMNWMYVYSMYNCNIIIIIILIIIVCLRMYCMSSWTR